MPLELRRGRNGQLRPTWYGRYEVNGKRYTINLGVRVAGNPPDTLSLRDEGDRAFERSRALAHAKLEQMIEEARNKQHASHLVERIYEIKTGEQIRSVLLANLPAEWAKIPRKRKPNKRYASQCQSMLTRFSNAIAERHPKIKEIAHITRQVAQEFMEAESDRGMTSKTWNDTLKLLRATFKYLLPAGSINPFLTIPTRETETIFRIPFSPEELKAIVEAAKDDDFLRPILITGICTAMRRGDCCLLKWKDVDLKRRFLTVKTNKTGQTVSIPIFPMLFDELSSREPSEAYVFPEQAKMYLENPDGITWRVRKIFATAGFLDKPNSTEELHRGEVHATRETGLRRASVRDFHSFRVTWVTLALTAGVPLELVQKVTGHKTTEVVLKHYYQPGREAFRQALQSAMPKLLTNGQKTPKDEMLELVNNLTAKNVVTKKKKLLELIDKI